MADDESLKIPFTVIKVVEAHPDWDDWYGSREYEILHFDNKEKADKEAKRLGSSYGDETHRSYYHYVRTNSNC
jgi:hypothetical protein